ncbi:MAG: universal stress protein [Gammaproteobacteria bacterium]|nr:universal stress protein [Gammaproteobacteria bacterium]
MYKRVVLAYDGSESGQKALLDGFDIARWSHGELFLIAIIPQLATAIFGMEGGLYQSASDEQSSQQHLAVLKDGLRQISGLGVIAKGEVLTGESVEEITRYARKIDADLIVVSHKHRDGWAARWWSGSKSPALIEHAHCSVLVVITQ